MPVYSFAKDVRIIEAIDKYLRDSFEGFTGVSYNGVTLEVYTNYELGQGDLDTLATLVTDYTDPEYFLVLSSTNSKPLSSSFTQDPNQTIIDGDSVMQTFIYNGNTLGNDGEILDGIKTIFEYNVDNLQNFINITSASLCFDIHNLTLDTVVMSRTVDLGSIATDWHNLAVSGATHGSTRYRTELFSGLMNESPGYDCMWQFRGCVQPDSTFDFRVNSYQELFYNKIQ